MNSNMDYYIIQVIYEMLRQKVNFSKVKWHEVLRAAKQLKKYNEAIPNKAKRK